MGDAEDVSTRWARGLREAADQAYTAASGLHAEPERAPSRWRIEPRAAVAVVVVLLVLGTWAWWGLRPPAVMPLAPAAEPTASPAAWAATPPAMMTVHVSGEVAQPGVVELEAGSRIIDAVELAGGLTGSADPSSVNLARFVADGEQIVVREEGAPDGEGPVNLNSASASRLEDLSGVGPVLAARIVADREANGPFASVEDLGRVSGVGQAILAGLADAATV
ncbi:ComEA family DNA-binding protein [Demequina pelophila]|uniref:ComEA family DNA-binding protein n=1 Tax=Demequina pelophila TaxID=1638984 RepID=UPI0007828A09|nr:ComEA family DNA-binding protein [Demequina pelophila]